MSHFRRDNDAQVTRNTLTFRSYHCLYLPCTVTAFIQLHLIVPAASTAPKTAPCNTSSNKLSYFHPLTSLYYQVYELRDKGTTTKKDMGTNPPIVTTYIAGLRGKPNPDARTVSKYVTRTGNSAGNSGNRSRNGSERDDAKPTTVPEQLRARVVTLKLDL